MRNIITVFKKEFYRVMSDRRLVFTTIFLPGLAIYIMYSFLGNVIGNEIEDIEEHTMIIYTENMPVEFSDYVTLQGANIEYFDYEEVLHDNIVNDILIGEVDLLIRFPETFEEDIDNLITPDILLYFNSGEKYSESSYYQFNNYLYTYAELIGYERYGDAYYSFILNTELIIDEDKAVGQGFAMLLPMLIIMFLFGGAMQIGPDSIAGEKERGTIATLLVTPIKRSEIAIGKVLSLSVIALFSATSSFIGIMLSLPKLMQQENLSITIYGLDDLLMLFTVLIATVLVIVGIIAVVSAYAKTIKEASMFILPIYFLSIIIGMSTMLSGEANPATLVYLIPIYSTVNIIISILTFEVTITTFLLTIFSSLVYVSIFIYILTRLFQSEKAMFSK